MLLHPPRESQNGDTPITYRNMNILFTPQGDSFFVYIYNMHVWYTTSPLTKLLTFYYTLKKVTARH